MNGSKVIYYPSEWDNPADLPEEGIASYVSGTSVTVMQYIPTTSMG